MGLGDRNAFVADTQRSPKASDQQLRGADTDVETDSDGAVAPIPCSRGADVCEKFFEQLQCLAYPTFAWSRREAITLLNSSYCAHPKFAWGRLLASSNEHYKLAPIPRSRGADLSVRSHLT